MKLKTDEKIVIGGGVIIILFLGYLYVSTLIYEQNKPYTASQPEIVMSPSTEITEDVDTYWNNDVYQPPKFHEIRRERMACGKKLYANGEYFAAREEFYAADAYNSHEAAFWIERCNQHLEPAEEENNEEEEE